MLTSILGLGRDGQRTDAYWPGTDLVARCKLLVERCRGQLSQLLEDRFR